jgi:ribonuclease E
MAKRMLIDATQGEETRVAVIDGNRLDELDFEIASRKQLKGNIYLAKVTRVEPSLQAAFVEYGGNRQGFLAFAEIHPDYYKIPVADREKLLALEREEAEREAAEEEAELAGQAMADAMPMAEDGLTPMSDAVEAPITPVDAGSTPAAPLAPAQPLEMSQPELSSSPVGEDFSSEPMSDNGEPVELPEGAPTPANGEEVVPPPPAHAEEGEEDADRRKRARRRSNILRQYKIQEVIKKNQVMLIQVVKEERGNKGAALTTYLSLAGRYCVLMPNTNRGGGVSRKISSLDERRRMKSLLAELDLPEGMSIILRTAGLERSKADIKRDLEYLVRLWDSIRERTITSTAPSLIHEEANLIRRAIRDLYSREVIEVQVEGDNGYRTAKDFMRMMVPSAARRVHHYRDPAVPLFVRHRVESQIESLYSTTVGLKSGGYIVINQTEALVAIDVNSGRSTRERNIEETALRTNIEAAEEVARQVRLRDLAGLIVIDFIDMEEQRHNAQVERRLREAMKHDRARIQLGRISMFGLMELSRQRLRPSLIETNFSMCPTCGGIGHVRSIESAALHVLRSIEEEGLQQKASELAVSVAEPVALYLLNHKRAALSDVERRYGIKVFIHSDENIIKHAEHKIERQKARVPGEFQFPEPPPPVIEDEPVESNETDEDMPAEDSILGAGSSEESRDDGESDETGKGGEGGEDRGGRGRRRRRGGRGRFRDRASNNYDVAQPGAPQPEIPLGEGEELQPANLPSPEEQTGYIAMTAHDGAEGQPPGQGGDNDQRRGRRRGRRGGRGRFRERGPRDPSAMEGQPQPEMAEGMPADASAEGQPPPPRENRGHRGEQRGEHQGGRRNWRERGPREDRGPRLSPTPPGGGGEGGGIKIVSEFKAREPAAPASSSAPTPAPAASTPPTPAPGNDKPKSGWWKRLMG